MLRDLSPETMARFLDEYSLGFIDATDMRDSDGGPVDGQVDSNHDPQTSNARVDNEQVSTENPAVALLGLEQFFAPAFPFASLEYDEDEVLGVGEEVAAVEDAGVVAPRLEGTRGVKRSHDTAFSTP